VGRRGDYSGLEGAIGGVVRQGGQSATGGYGWEGADTGGWATE
jgi:hypothetical protein